MPEQLGRVYLGLTDEDAPGPIPDVPEPTSEEIGFLLDTVNTALDVTLGRDDVIGAYAGLRPLIDTGAGRTADVSRDHAVVESPSGVISVIGGKLTEYRYMAEDVLDKAVELRGLTAGDCRTRNLPLVGAPSNPVATLSCSYQPICHRRWSRGSVPKRRTSSPRPPATGPPIRWPTEST